MPLRHVFASGRTSGGPAHSRGALFHLLRNPACIGCIAHKGKVHPGAHQGIVEPALFEGAADGECVTQYDKSAFGTFEVRRDRQAFTPDKIATMLELWNRHSQ